MGGHSSGCFHPLQPRPFGTASGTFVRRSRADTLPDSVAWAPRARFDTDPPGAFATRLSSHLALGVREMVNEVDCIAMTRAVMAARSLWTADFGGEQHSLGRAFYTHLETGQSALYFSDAAASDARVERVLPGLQPRMRGMLAQMLGAQVTARSGWCGAGVHVFAPGGKVARVGGVMHFDTEGLTRFQRAARAAAVTLVLMLCPPRRGGGLRLWDVAFDGRPDTDLDDAVLAAAARRTLRYRVGDAVLMDSYRLHQIAPFWGDMPRVSATLHAVAVGDGLWESWF